MYTDSLSVIRAVLSTRIHSCLYTKLKKYIFVENKPVGIEVNFKFNKNKYFSSNIYCSKIIQEYKLVYCKS
jgi:hypothetical protein